MSKTDAATSIGLESCAAWLLARALAPIDPVLGCLTARGAAFIALTAVRVVDPDKE